MVTAPERTAEVRAAAWLPSSVVAVVEGGDRRQLRSRRGCARSRPVTTSTAARTDDARIVLVHDGARPLVSPALVREVIRATAEHGAGQSRRSLSPRP